MVAGSSGTYPVRARDVTEVQDSLQFAQQYQNSHQQGRV
jgi:hypothetical protein